MGQGDMKFSANLGFLWTDRALPEAIAAAADAGFDAVECHWPYDVPAADVSAVLSRTGLSMLGLNTRRGNLEAGENGLSALPGREDAARDAIDEAVAYGAAIGARMVHVMAGVADGGEAYACFARNLAYAARVASARGMEILIEPLNAHDAPGYFLNGTDQAVALIKEVAADNLKLMFDCYHIARAEGDLTARLSRLLPHIGHIQFAGVPDRGAPDEGEVAYTHIFEHIRTLGWTRPLGAEYKPFGPTEPTLGWLPRARAL